MGALWTKPEPPPSKATLSLGTEQKASQDCSPSPSARAPPPARSPSPRFPSPRSPPFPPPPFPARPASASCAHSAGQRRAPRSPSAAQGHRLPLPGALTAGPAPARALAGGTHPQPSSEPPVPAGPTGRQRERAGERSAAAREGRGARQAHGSSLGRTEPSCPPGQSPARES